MMIQRERNRFIDQWREWYILFFLDGGYGLMTMVNTQFDCEDHVVLMVNTHFDCYCLIVLTAVRQLVPCNVDGRYSVQR